MEKLTISIVWDSLEVNPSKRLKLKLDHRAIPPGCLPVTLSTNSMRALQPVTPSRTLSNWIWPSSTSNSSGRGEPNGTHCSHKYASNFRLDQCRLSSAIPYSFNCTFIDTLSLIQTASTAFIR